MAINLKTGQNFDIEDNNQQPFYTTQVLDPSILAQIQGNPKGLRLLVDSQKRLWAPAAMLVSPQNPVNGLCEVATVQPYIFAPNTAQPGLVTHSYLYAHTSSNQEGPATMSSFLDPTYGINSALAVSDLKGGLSNTNFLEMIEQMFYHSYTVSPNNTAQDTGIIDLRGLHSTLGIFMTCSAGTAPVTVSVSGDGTIGNAIVVDAIAAAATVTKNYNPTAPATTIGVFPLSFRWLRVQVGAAGSGNATTLYVGAK